MNKVSWNAPEYIHTPKTTDWYWVVGIVSISIAIIAIILNNILFAILVIVSTFILTLFASRPPQHVSISVDQAGLTIGSTFYPYSELDSFWVETGDAYPRVFFQSIKKLSTYIVVLIRDVEAEDIRDILLDHLLEVRHSESFMEKVLIYFGF